MVVFVYLFPVPVLNFVAAVSSGLFCSVLFERTSCQNPWFVLRYKEPLLCTPKTAPTIIYNAGCLTAGFSADATNMGKTATNIWKTSSTELSRNPSPRMALRHEQLQRTKTRTTPMQTESTPPIPRRDGNWRCQFSSSKLGAMMQA